MVLKIDFALELSKRGVFTLPKSHGKFRDFTPPAATTTAPIPTSCPGPLQDPFPGFCGLHCPQSRTGGFHMSRWVKTSRVSFSGRFQILGGMAPCTGTPRAIFLAPWPPARGLPCRRGKGKACLGAQRGADRCRSRAGCVGCGRQAGPGSGPQPTSAHISPCCRQRTPSAARVQTPFCSLERSRPRRALLP